MSSAWVHQRSKLQGLLPLLLDELSEKHPLPVWLKNMWAMVNTHYMVDGHPIYNKDPYNGYYKSLWTIGWLAPINDY